MTPLAHLIMFSGYGEPSPWVCTVCGRSWEALPTFGDPERVTCPGIGVGVE